MGVTAARIRGPPLLRIGRDDGTDQATHDLPRRQDGEKVGRAEDPTAVVLQTTPPGP